MGTSQANPCTAASAVVSNETIPEDLVAFESLRPSLEAMSPEEFIPINTQVSTAVMVVYAAHKDLVSLQEEAARYTPMFDFSLIEHVRERARALHYIDTLYTAQAALGQDLPRFAAEGAQLRDLLRDSAQLVGRLGLMPGTKLDAIDGGNGYRAIADDIETYANALRTHWDTVQGKVPVDLPTLARANRLSEEMLHALGARDRTSPEIVSAARLRQAAFTLLAHTWQEIRRVVAYLRPNGDDADRLAPSIYVRGPVVERKKDAEAAKPVAASDATAAVATTVSQKAVVSPFPALTQDVPNSPGSRPFVT